jgi:hypothetical protein
VLGYERSILEKAAALGTAQRRRKGDERTEHDDCHHDDERSHGHLELLEAHVVVDDVVRPPRRRLREDGEDDGSER